MDECFTPDPFQLILTCEHGGNQIPEPYRVLFAGEESCLDSHSGFDAGALELSERLHARFRCPFFYSTISRLLVDLNRSPGHPKLFSSVTRPLPKPERDAILEHHYFPHRLQVEQAVQSAIERGKKVLHLGVHSFTPEWNGVLRTADIGLLYDPRREGEKQFVLCWKKNLEQRMPGFSIRRNDPYRGIADGLTTFLRRQFPGNLYAGIELEINQKWILPPAMDWPFFQEKIISSVETILKTGRGPEVPHDG